MVAGFNTAIDAVESWIAGQSFWVQVPILLGVLLPLAWTVAGLIDKVVDRLLWPSTRREARLVHPAGRRRAPGRGPDHQPP